MHYSHLITFEIGNGVKWQKVLETEGLFIKTQEWNDFTSAEPMLTGPWVVVNCLTLKR